MEHASKAVGAVAAWLGPALAVWLTDEPWVAMAFIGSTVATFTWFMSDLPNNKKSKDDEQKGEG